MTRRIGAALAALLAAALLAGCATTDASSGNQDRGPTFYTGISAGGTFH
jgi:outer membrane protein assembly factor BamE (lipoprotein component of BamABCDE complex)